MAVLEKVGKYDTSLSNTSGIAPAPTASPTRRGKRGREAALAQNGVIIADTDQTNITNQSGGVDVNAQRVDVEGDATPGKSSRPPGNPITWSVPSAMRAYLGRG
jgi:hypothetical protein